MSITIVAIAALIQVPSTGIENRLPLADSIRIERKGCYGSCPVYRATLYSNGTIRYFGESFVDLKGDHKGQISHWDLVRLDQLGERLGFNRLNPRYASGATDLETTIITITRGKSVQRVSCYGDKPFEFWGMQVAIERVIEDSKDTWLPVG